MTEPLDIVATGEARLNEKIDLARHLRKVGELPAIEHGPIPAAQMLLTVRQQMDQIEDVLSEVLRFRTQLRHLAKEAGHLVDDRWAQKVTSRPDARIMKSFDGFGDTAPRERYAAADLHVLDDRIRARQRERLLDAANDAVDIIRGALRGLDGLRNDLHVLIRALNVESRLER